MSTVAARLNAALHNTPGPQALVRGIVLSAADAVALDRLIAELCPAEQACEACNTRLCDRCGIGEFGCSHGRVLCPDCTVLDCIDCARDARAEAHGDPFGIAYGGAS